MLIPYFFFNYGVIFEIVDTPSNYAFLPSAQQSQRVVAYNYSKDWSYFVISPTPAQAVSANAWLGSSMRPQTVYVDSSSTAMGGSVWVWPGIAKRGRFAVGGRRRYPPPRLLCLFGTGKRATRQVLVLVNNSSYEEWPISSFPSLTAGNLVYSNGLAIIYYYT